MRLELVNGIQEEPETTFKVTVQREEDGSILIQGAGNGHRWSLCSLVIKSGKVELRTHQYIRDGEIRTNERGEIFVARSE